jgi:hypothetical protein
MANLFAIPDFYRLAFPALLLAFYVFCWLAVGRDPKIGVVAPLYEPPKGISPGVARYILTGGSDGTTLAAVLAGLAVKGVVAIQPDQGSYAVTLLNSSSALLPDEASLVKTLFKVEVTAQLYADCKAPIPPGSNQQTLGTSFNASSQPSSASKTMVVDDAGSAAALAPSPDSQVVINPQEGPTIKGHIDAIQETFHKNFHGIYFRQNFRYAGIGVVATLLWAMYTSATLDAQSSMFLTFWLFMFTSIAGMVIGGIWASKPSRPSVKQRVTRLLVPVVFFGFPGAVIYFAALPQSHGFVLALLLSVMLNSIFFFIMRAPTARGLIMLQQLAGFREFLLRVEQDPLDRVNTPEQRAELMNRFLPYAIALNVREGWGDKMASAFSDAIVER